MQTTRCLVSTFFKLATKFQNGHHSLKSADLAIQFLGQLLVPGHRNATPIILNRHTAIGVNGDGNRLGEISHRLIDGIVDNLVNEMMQSARSGVADVHARPFSHMLEVGQVLQIRIGVVRICGGNGKSGSFVGGRTRLRSIAHEDLQKRG